MFLPISLLHLATKKKKIKWPVTNMFMQTAPRICRLTGNGRLDDILSDNGFVPMGEVKSD